MRAGLCLIGLISAPLQSVWVYSQALNWAHQVFCGPLRLCPLAVIEAFKGHLLQQCKDRWRVPAMYLPRTILLEDASGIWPVALTQPTAGRQLIEAEKKMRGPGLSLSLHESGRPLSLDAFLHEGVGYTLHVERQRQAKDMQLALPSFRIVLLLPSRFVIVTRTTPIALRALLEEFGISVSAGVSVLSGAIIGLDDLLAKDDLLYVRPVLPEIYRDETALDWSELCKAPIRLLLQSGPLQGCCLCPGLWPLSCGS